MSGIEGIAPPHGASSTIPQQVSALPKPRPTTTHPTLSGECARCSPEEPISVSEPASDRKPDPERARPATVPGLSSYDLASSWPGTQGWGRGGDWDSELVYRVGVASGQRFALGWMEQGVCVAGV